MVGLGGRGNSTNGSCSAIAVRQRAAIQRRDSVSNRISGHPVNSSPTVVCATHRVWESRRCPQFTTHDARKAGSGLHEAQVRRPVVPHRLVVHTHQPPVAAAVRSPRISRCFYLPEANVVILAAECPHPPPSHCRRGPRTDLTHQGDTCLYWLSHISTRISRLQYRPD